MSSSNTFKPVAISVIYIKSESLMTSGAAQSKFSRKASWSPLLLAGLASRSAKYKNNKKYQVQARRLSWTAKSDKRMFSKSEIFNLKCPSTKQFFEFSWKWVQNWDFAESFFRCFLNSWLPVMTNIRFVDENHSTDDVFCEANFHVQRKLKLFGKIIE